MLLLPNPVSFLFHAMFPSPLKLLPALEGLCLQEDHFLTIMVYSQTHLLFVQQVLSNSYMSIIHRKATEKFTKFYSPLLTVIDDGMN